MLIELVKEHKHKIEIRSAPLKTPESGMDKERSREINEKIAADYLILSKLYGALNNTASKISSEGRVALHLLKAGMERPKIETIMSSLRSGSVINIGAMVDKKKAENIAKTIAPEPKASHENSFSMEFLDPIYYERKPEENQE